MHDIVVRSVDICMNGGSRYSSISNNARIVGEI